MKTEVVKDPLIRVSTLAATANPQTLCWLAAHQDYSSEPVDQHQLKLTEAEYGEALINHCVKFGHWGVLEHPQITLACSYFPHSVLQQARTHRVAVSFDCQSFRYTSDSLHKVNTLADVEKAIYFRPVGTYTDRKGKHYDYTLGERLGDIEVAYELICYYKTKVTFKGMSEEHARGLLPFDYRQHFVVSFNPRSLLHFCDLRHKANAQLEIQWLAQGAFEQFEIWMPEVAAHYRKTRLNKGRLAP